MSLPNSSKVSTNFKSPLKNDVKSSPLSEKNLMQEYETLTRKEESLDRDIYLLGPSEPGSSAAVKSVMELLHQFNEVKDATQVVLGKLAAIEGVPVKQMHERFGLSDSD